MGSVRGGIQIRKTSLQALGKKARKTVTGRTRLIEGNKPLTEGNRTIFKLLACCFSHFFLKCLLASIQQRLCFKGAMSHTAHVREEALHLENVRQLFQVLRVIQYQEFIVFYLSHPLTVRIVIRSLLLYYFLNPKWRTVEKINRAGKNPAHAQVVT